MTQRNVDITTPDGTMDATLHTPAGRGPWPGVIMFPDAGGVRPAFHQMADRLADLGYVVLLPNIYYRIGEYEPMLLLLSSSNPVGTEAADEDAVDVAGDVALQAPHGFASR
ncbi:MAG: dienelactone hydrolase family protein, partial [Ilumatobacteraceae bacterium]